MKTSPCFLFKLFTVVFAISGQLLLAQQAPLPSEAMWAERGDDIWKLASNEQSIFITGTDGQRYTIPVVGQVDFLMPVDPNVVEIEAQMAPTVRTASGEVVRDDLRQMDDPIDGTNAMQSGGSFMARPLPFDFDEAGNPLGLQVLDAKNPNSKTYNRIGVRLAGTPAGRLMFLFEMTDASGGTPTWFAREYIAPLPGCPWQPTPDAVTGDNRKSHLSKLAVFRLEPWQDPADRIPVKLQRSDVKVDFDATVQGLDWEQLKDWMEQNITDETVPVEKPFVIQLPSGNLEDVDGFGITCSKWSGWGKAITALSEGRKVWLVGHPQTTIPTLRLAAVKNLGVLFCRFTRLDEDSVMKPTASRFSTVLELDGENIDIRNNWVECPDGVSDGALILRGFKNSTVLDNLFATGGAPISTPGGARVVSSIIARNWMERGHDAIQMYGGWSDTIIAYNHAVSASGYANRESNSWHLGSNLHSDEVQSQANQTDIYPQSFYLFSNFFQFGRHNWPALWGEIGGGTQNFIIDGDSYKDSAIYWNVFQNLAPAGHRGIKTIGPDKAWALADPKRNQRNYIENLSIMGNAFLVRWDHNNHSPYGYLSPNAGITGSFGPTYFELLNTENLYARTHQDMWSALFKQVVDGRPDPEAREGWRADVPTLTDIYEHPIVYTGSKDQGYQADFSHTSYAGDKFLNGWVSPVDYAPKPAWSESASGAAGLTPLSELQKIPDMPTDLAVFLGDPARQGDFFAEFSGPAVAAKKTVLESPWRVDALNDGFLLHIKFGSVGTPGTWRELLSEQDDTRSYRVALTEENTVRFELYQDGELISRIESTDTYEDGDHLSMQVYTPYFPTHPESTFPYAMLSHVYEAGIRRIHYISSAEAPVATNASNDDLYVWMDTSSEYRFFEWRAEEWMPVLGARDSIHASAIRSFSEQRNKSFHGPENTPALRRDLYPIDAGRWYTMHLDGPGLDSTTVWQDGDLRWMKDGMSWGSVFRNNAGKSAGSIGSFGSMTIASGRPRCFIRHNIDHADKRSDWLWTPDVDLARGQVTLFGSFDGSFETFRIIRGGQGENGEPANYPAYRILESIASALSFIRPPLDSTGKVPGWGTPDIFLHGR